MKYDRAANVANAVSSLEFQGTPLQWHRLDDGVMGGQSETVHRDKDGSLHFTGTINTNGGGFCSVRAPLGKSLSKDTAAIRLLFRGDGKTYKLHMSDGTGGGPFARNPAFHADIPTNDKMSTSEDWQEANIPLSSFKATWGGRAASAEHSADFDVTKMTQIGIMLSLKLSDGSDNPKETFGEGIFPFNFYLKSIEAVPSTPSSTK